MKKKISLEDIFLASLSSNQKLRWYLQYDINVVNYLDAKFPKYMFLASTMITLTPKSKIKELVGDIDSKRILKIIEKERPELHKTLITAPNGLNWLERQIDNFKKRFL